MTKALIIDPSGRPVISAKRARRAATSRYLRGDNLGTIPMRQASLRDHREDVRAAWPRAAALTVDILQNNDRLSGAVDQILADTVGTELVVIPNPDFTGLKGWTPKRRKEWIALVKKRFRLWQNDPMECDLRGKQTIGQMTDANVRWSIGYGEGTGIVSYLTPEERARRGAVTGTKICMIQPHRLVQETNELERLYQGVVLDMDNLPIFYRFKERIKGIEGTKDYLVRDRDGRTLVIHTMDGEPGDLRGIGKFAPAIKSWLQYDQLTDATMAQQLIQTVFAATLKSSNIDGDALEGLLQLNDIDDADELVENIIGYQAAKYDAAAREGIDFSTHGRVNSLPAGDELEFHTPGSTKDTYIPLSNNLIRGIARCLSVTTSSLTMDYSEATYSSVRMEYASIWPLIIRRRYRIAAPVPKIAYENWLDEEIGEGRIPFYGGYAAFKAMRKQVSAVTIQGPTKPTADDQKSSKAQTERMHNGTTSMSIECAENGLDRDEVIAERAEELKMLKAAGLPNVFERNPGAGKTSAEEKDEVVDV